MDRFWSKVDKTGDCWIWQSTLRNGYGIFHYQKKKVSAHRLAYELVVGPPGDKKVRHTCDTPACVRPEHLVLGSYKDNSRDMLDRDRHIISLNNDDIVRLREEKTTHYNLGEIAERYGILPENAWRIITGRVAKHLPGAHEIPQQRHLKKLSLRNISEIKAALKKPYWGQVNELAEKYGVSHSFISHIKLGLAHTDTN